MPFFTRGKKIGAHTCNRYIIPNIFIGYSVKIVVNILKYRRFREDALLKCMLKGTKEQILEAEMIFGKKTNGLSF
jgi:hypothetical protein